jgi:hypothetical protein
MIPVQFTPGQLREIVGISVETFRHWKRVLPSFSKRKRYVRSFTIGDLLAGGILRQLTEGCGIRIGHLTKVSDEIVRLCNAAAWASLEQKALLIDLVKGTCRLSEPSENVADDVILRCMLRPIVRDLRDALIQSQPTSNQHSLVFLPLEVESERRVGRRAS